MKKIILMSYQNNQKRLKSKIIPQLAIEIYHSQSIQKINAMLQENYDEFDVLSQDTVNLKKDLQINHSQVLGNLYFCKNDEKDDQRIRDSELFQKARQNKMKHRSQQERQRKLQLILRAQSAIFSQKYQCQLYESILPKQSKDQEQHRQQYVAKQKIHKPNFTPSKRRISWRSIRSILHAFKHQGRVCYQVQLKSKQIVKVESFNLHRLCPQIVLEFYEKHADLIKQE